MKTDIKIGTILQSYGDNIDVNADIRKEFEDSKDIEDNLHFFQSNENKILIKYHADIDKIEWKEGSDWVDLRAAEDVELKEGDSKLISLGVSMKFSSKYEAHVIPRSSTHKNFKTMQSNSIGIIDSNYCGNNDIWKYPVIALKDTVIHKNDRICQFRLVEKMKPVTFIEVDKLDSKDRGGFGSTGIQ